MEKEQQEQEDRTREYVVFVVFLSDSNNLFFNHFRKSAATGLSLFKYTTTNTTDETRETNHRYMRQNPTHLPVFNYSWQYFSVSFTKNSNKHSI